MHVGYHQFRESLRDLLREFWVFVLHKSWDAIPRMGFRIPRIILSSELRELLREYPGNAPRAPKIAFSLRELSGPLNRLNAILGF